MKVNKDKRDEKLREEFVDEHRRGHRVYVGGIWDEMGKWQMARLKEFGLKKDDNFLDIGCGSMRLGCKLIPWMKKGHYFGVERVPALVELGHLIEVGEKVWAKKEPKVLLTENFEFGEFGVRFDFAWAQSVFSHLPEKKIIECLTKLYPVLENDGVFYATFIKSNDGECHKVVKKERVYVNYKYPVSKALEFGRKTGYKAAYLGDCGHPRGQIIVEFRKDVQKS